MIKSAALTFKSKSSKPVRTEKDGPLYDGYNHMFECSKKDFTYDEAWEQCNYMIERMKETENYDIGFIHKQYFNNFRHRFGVILGKEIKAEEGEN